MTDFNVRVFARQGKNWKKVESPFSRRSSPFTSGSITVNVHTIQNPTNPIRVLYVQIRIDYLQCNESYDAIEGAKRRKNKMEIISRGESTTDGVSLPFYLFFFHFTPETDMVSERLSSNL